MQENRRGLKKASIQAFAAYLALIIVPLAAVLIFYMEANHGMLSVQYEKTSRLQAEAVTNFERQLTEVDNISTYLLQNEKVMTFARGIPDKTQEFWEKYCFAQQQPDYHLTNQIIESVYLITREGKYIIRLPAVVPASTLGYVTVNRFAIDSYEEFLDRFCEQWYYGNIVLLGNEQDELRMAVVHSMNRIKKEIPGVIVITLNPSGVKAALKSCNPDDAAITCIVNDDNVIIGSYAGTQSPLSAARLREFLISLEEYTADHSDGVYQTAKLDGEEYLICSRRSKKQCWNYVTAVPVRILTQQIDDMRFWRSLLAALAVLLSLAICFFYWYRRKRIIRQYYELCPEGGHDTELSFRTGFWGGLQSLLSYVSHLQKTMALQDGLVQTAILRKLLYGEYVSQEELLRDLVNGGMEFSGKEIYTVVWSADGMQDSGQFSDMTVYRSFLREFMRQELPWRHYVYEMDFNTLALLLCDEKIGSLADVRNQFLQLNSKIKETAFLTCYTGITTPVSDILQVSSAFDCARKACSYALYYHITIPVDKAELPVEPADQSFSAETEKKLCSVIQDGTEEELAQLLISIREEAQQRKPDLHQINHYMNFVRSAAIHTLIGYCVEPAMLSAVGQIGEANDWDMLFARILRAKRELVTTLQVPADTRSVQMRALMMEHMTANYQNTGYSIAQLAQAFHMSESKMYKDFRMYFGKSFSEQLEELRMEAACELLKQGVQIKEISTRTGYTSDVTFRRAFKRRFGKSPTDFLLE